VKVLITGNAHLYKTDDGKYYTPSIYSHEFFQRYLDVFDEVRFIAKTKYVSEIDTSKFLLVSRDGLEIYELPWYQGVKEMLKNIFNLIKRYRKSTIGCDCFIYRISQIESFFTFIFSKKNKNPFSVEVVNDPTSFKDMRTVYKFINIFLLKYMIKRANGVSYVTKEYLQNKYPSKASLKGESEKFFESSYSSIELSENDILSPKIYKDTKKNFKIIHVANAITGEMKGHRTLIDAAKIVIDSGYDITVFFIGDGLSVKKFKQYASDSGVENRVKFIGRIHSKKAIMSELSEKDLFVFPSQSEGLPRSVIEALAVGLPCLSTPVGGIPELINKRYLFSPMDKRGFAHSIISLIENPQELERMSYDNINKAREFTNQNLTLKRNYFYNKLKNLVINRLENDKK